MRLINEDDVLEIIERVTNEAVEKKQRKYLIQPRIIAEISGLPTIKAEPDNGWISVEDRLPEIKEHYRSELVMCYSPDGEHECLFDYYEMNGFGQGCFTAEKVFWHYNYSLADITRTAERRIVMDYISREEAIKALYEVYEHEYPTASGDFDEYARHDVQNILNGLPAADVQPVKHGRWETWGYIFHGIAWKRCSVCGKTADLSYQALLDGEIEMATTSICGCCGCRMDGDSE